jgi:hypothetical protein
LMSGSRKCCGMVSKQRARPRCLQSHHPATRPGRRRRPGPLNGARLPPAAAEFCLSRPPAAGRRYRHVTTRAPIPAAPARWLPGSDQ